MIAPNGRNADGTFAKGWKGGPGRPRREREGKYLDALTDGCPLKTWKRIIARAVKDALKGDRWARQWLGEYLLPPVVGPVDDDDERLSHITVEIVEKPGGLTDAELAAHDRPVQAPGSNTDGLV